MKTSTKGFTLVELVIALLLVAILSTTVFSRWYGDNAYRVSALRAEFVSYARLAQRIALANRDLGIHLVLLQLSGEWRIRILQVDGGVSSTLHSFETDLEDISVTATSGGAPVNISSGTFLIVEFDGSGNIDSLSMGGSNGVPGQGVAVSFSGSSTQDMCISSLGFAHNGACI